MTAQLDALGSVEEVAITTARPDGSLRPSVPIWVVRVGEEVYVRSYRGGAGAWYRHANQTGRARIRVADSHYDVTAEKPVEPNAAAHIDQAYAAKYGHHGDSYVSAMITDAAAATTLRLRPIANQVNEGGQGYESSNFQG
jgi:hypothetical protein